MHFEFRRERDGTETIHVGDATVWWCGGDMRTNAGRSVASLPGIDDKVIEAAIERADEVGFWTGLAPVPGFRDFLPSHTAFEMHVPARGRPPPDYTDNVALSIVREGDDDDEDGAP